MAKIMTFGELTKKKEEKYFVLCDFAKKSVL